MDQKYLLDLLKNGLYCKYDECFYDIKTLKSNKMKTINSNGKLYSELYGLCVSKEDEITFYSVMNELKICVEVLVTIPLMNILILFDNLDKSLIEPGKYKNIPENYLRLISILLHGDDIIFNSKFKDGLNLGLTQGQSNIVIKSYIEYKNLNNSIPLSNNKNSTPLSDVLNNNNSNKFVKYYKSPNNTPSEIKIKEPKIKKEFIPQTNLRDDVWLKHFDKSDIGNCFCCNGILNKNSVTWEAGHVQAASKGGNTELDNIKPVCADCNRGKGGMHTTNMYEYMIRNNMYGLEHLEDYQKKLWLYGKERKAIFRECSELLDELLKKESIPKSLKDGLYEVIISDDHSKNLLFYKTVNYIKSLK
jgi:5-methylcytosine-specific restriction endonuclease McrA